ncbi:Na+/H+ antiporter NhaC family protein [Intestinibacter sp.]|uniref:Na+/H+ antiporter NhaC family protein n=1 Tax=Intestinibacter sp. TaxID=1965304 RepID=UPI003F15EB6B
MMDERIEKRERKSYGSKALIPILIFVGLYIGCGCIFTLLKMDNPFSIMSRYISILIAIIFSLIYYEPHRSLTEKVEIYCSKAGKKGVILLGFIVLMAGGFSSAAEVIGGKESLVNLGLTFIPIHFLIPGIFVICAVISTCIGTSMGTIVTMLPIAYSLSSGTGLNPGMVGAAVITGAFFGDNLSMISDTTICATKGVGAEIKDKFRVNFFVALPAALITIVMYMVFSPHSANQSIVAGEYHIEAIIPYLLVLVLAIKGMDVVMVLTIGIASCCVIGVATGRISFFEWAQAVSSGMENMFWLVVFSTLVSGLIGLVEYYGGVDWLINTVSKKIHNRRGCESIIGLLSLLISGVIVNNTMAIIITAPVAKELGEKYEVSPKRMASLLDIGACLAVMLAPHGSAVMMIQETIGCNYLEIVRYQFYPFLLILCTAVMIGFKIERRRVKNYE